MKIRAFFILFFFLLVSGSICSVVVAKPNWLKEGLVVTYKFSAYDVITRVIGVTPDGRGTSVESMFSGNGTYSWAVKSLNGSDAEVEVDIDFVYEDYDIEKMMFFTNSWNKTASVRINVDDRETMASNGTSLGKINYWIDLTIEKGQNVIVYGKPPYTVSATVYEYRYNPLKTPAGEFNCWLLQIGGKRPDLGNTARLDLFYDKATGILVAAHMFYFDVALMSMGIAQMQITGDKFSAPSDFVLQAMETLSSSSSSTHQPRLSDYLPYIYVAIVVTVIPAAVYVTRRHKKRLS